ncbi:putative molybdenum cofactor synthesis domain containing protein [Rhypophila sp. PSN 637]
MFSRVSQLSRHLSRPAISFSSIYAQGARTTLTNNSIMASTATADERNSRNIHTAACLIIGDEVLGGKTVDTNSAYMAKWCFSLGINLKRIEVIADDESEIIEAVRRMSDKFDFVVTSGGIGPTHDDITYQSIAKAFDLPLVLNNKTYELMKKYSKPRPGENPINWDEDSPRLRARLRMAELPTDKDRDHNKQFLFPCEDQEMWVPVAVVNGNIHILPGVPRIFQSLLDGLKTCIKPRLVDPALIRVIISTPLRESTMAPYLTELQRGVESHGVKVGSYPRMENKKNTVTLVGKDKEFLDSITPEVVENLQGRVVTVEGEDDELPEANL